MKRKVWTFRATNKDSYCLVPEISNVDVFSLSSESAFAGVRLRIVCGKDEGYHWLNEVGWSSDVFLKRYDISGDVRESWRVHVHQIFDVEFKDETILSFKVKGDFVRLSL
jgi:hypothetical protein